jgi:hypothetical protein
VIFAPRLGARPQESALAPEASVEIPQIKKVIILPASEVPDSDDFFDTLAGYLETQFGWYVAPRALAEEIRRRAAATTTLDAIDPKTGEVDMSRLTGADSGLVPRLASRARVNAVLEANLLQAKAEVHRMVARWDGVEEPIAGKGTTKLAKFTPTPVKGQISASTVVFKLWDARGRLLWSTRRGLTTLSASAGGNHLRDKPLPEFLDDTGAVQKWFAGTFAPVIGVAHPQGRAEASQPH